MGPRAKFSGNPVRYITSLAAHLRLGPWLARCTCSGVTVTTISAPGNPMAGRIVNARSSNSLCVASPVLAL